MGVKGAGSVKETAALSDAETGYLSIYSQQSFATVTNQSGSVRSHRVWWDACLPALDACSIVSSLAIVRLAFNGEMEDATFQLALVATTVFMVTAQITGLHRHPKASTLDRELTFVASTWSLTILTLAVLSLATRSGELYARSEFFRGLLLYRSRSDCAAWARG